MTSKQRLSQERNWKIFRLSGTLAFLQTIAKEEDDNSVALYARIAAANVHNILNKMKARKK